MLFRMGVNLMYNFAKIATISEFKLTIKEQLNTRLFHS